LCSGQECLEEKRESGVERDIRLGKEGGAKEAPSIEGAIYTKETGSYKASGITGGHREGKKFSTGYFIFFFYGAFVSIGGGFVGERGTGRGKAGCERRRTKCDE